MATLHFYHVAPIDFWAGAMTRESLLMEAAVRDASMELDVLDEHLDSLLEVAQIAFRKIDWEGDIMDGPFYFAVPNPDELAFAFGLVLKQSNNGSTFIASPVPLPHIEAGLMPPKNRSMLVVKTPSRR